MFNFAYLTDFGSGIKVTKLVQMEHQFVVLAPRAYHDGFNGCYNNANATNFDNFSLPDAGRIVSKNKETERPFEQCTVPAESILWREAEGLVIYPRSLNVSKPNIRYKSRLAKSICISSRALVSEAESVMHHFITDNKDIVSPFDGS